MIKLEVMQQLFSRVYLTKMKNFTIKGLENLKKIIKYTLDSNGFPKSRNIKSSIFSKVSDTYKGVV